MGDQPTIERQGTIRVDKGLINSKFHTFPYWYNFLGNLRQVNLNILKKLPKSADIAAVYAIIVAILYYPTINRFFWKLPSWILFASLGDLFNFSAYMFTVNFLESLLVLLGVLALCIILPRKWFYEHFVSRGVLLVVLTLGYIIYLGTLMQPNMPFPWNLIRLSPVIFLIILLIVFLLDQIGFLRKFLNAAADRFIVFLYISIPVSILSFAVVLIRNLF